MSEYEQRRLRVEANLKASIPERALNALIAPAMEALSEEDALECLQDDIVGSQLRCLYESGCEIVDASAVQKRLSEVGMGGHRSFGEAVEALIVACMAMEELRDQEAAKRKEAEATIAHLRQHADRWVPPQVSDLIDKATTKLESVEISSKNGWHDKSASEAAAASAYAEVARAVIALEGV